MAKPPQFSPTVTMVIERFSQALRDDDNVDDAAAERLIELINSDGAITGPKIQAALFQNAEDEAPDE